MKKSYNIIIAVFSALVLTSCSERFVERYDKLSVTTEQYVVGTKPVDCVFPVYYSGAWTAEFTEDVPWAELSTFETTGVRYVRVSCTRNRGPLRSAKVKVSCDNGETVIVEVQQKGLAGVDLVYDSSEISVPADNLVMSLGFSTTLTRDFFEDMMSDIVPSDAKGWITNLQLEMDSDTAAVYREGRLVFEVMENNTGTDRSAALATALFGSDGQQIGDTVVVNQSALTAYIKCPESMSIRKSAASRSFLLENNIGSLADSVRIDVKYPGPEKDFISNVSFDGTTVSFDISEAKQDREAQFDFSLEYGKVKILTGMKVSQRLTMEARQISIKELLDKFQSGETVRYPASSDYDDYVVLYVVGGRNPNIENNVNTDANKITTSENDRTTYAQDASENPVCGFRIRFQTSSQNTLSNGQKVRLMLGDCSLTKEEDPTRYTIEDCISKDFEILGKADIVPSSRTISSLTDADIYTYCQLQEMEFTQKLGSFTNVREYDAIKNPLSAKEADSQPFSNKFNNFQAKDGAANLMYDNENKAIYALINMACPWRRPADMTVPQGIGTVSGVIVHTEMPRWCGNMGRYCIRPLSKADFDIDEEMQSSFNTIAEWKLTAGVDGGDGVKFYQWQGGYTVGTSSNSSTQLVQNKMLATGGDCMKDAVIYSENRMLQRSQETTRDYPVAPMSGYRGTNVTDFNGPTTYGISLGSVLSFYGNPAGWLKWNDKNEYTGEGNGVVMEFSTQGLSGSMVAVSFSIASGYLKAMTETSTSMLNIAHQSSSSFPAYWKVEYATSDDGKNWTPYTDALNACTGVTGFEMKCAPWALNGASSYTLNYLATAKYPLHTQIDNSFGLVPYRYVLPSSVLGKTRVKVRIVPTSDIIYSHSEQWNVPGVTKQLRATVTANQNVNVNDAILIEDAQIQYR